MANKKTLAGMLAGLLTFGMVIVGCDNSSATVTISGTAKVGETLTAVIHDGYSSLRLAYQWMRMPDSGSAPVSIGANQNTYLLTDADVGSRIKVKVTYTLSNGSTSELVSEPTEAVVAAVSRVVAAEYRFTGTAIYSIGGTMTLTENTLTASGSSDDFTLTGVYTEDGGTFSGSNGNGSWAYLYNGAGKIGVVMHFTSPSENVKFQLGTNVSSTGYDGYYNCTPVPDDSGIQTAHNCSDNLVL